MSYILDALQRAQKVHDAQTVDTAPILAERVSDAPANPQARVLWATAAVLGLVSLTLIAWMIGRESAAPVSAPQTTRAAPVPAEPSPFGRTEDEPPARGQVRSLNVEAARARPAEAVPAPATSRQPAAVPARAQNTDGMIEITPVANRREQRPNPVAQAPVPAPSAQADPSLPDYENALLGGQINLPNLRLDMHVFHQTPSRRFVFINFKKFKEGDALDDGTRIEQITSDGAILNHKGRQFVLRPN